MTQRDRTAAQTSDRFEPLWWYMLCVAFGSMAMIMMTVVQARAQEHPTYEIPAQPLASALDRFAEQAQVQMLYQADAVNGLQSTSVSGRLTREQALNNLLRGTGLEFQSGGPNTFTLQPVAGSPAVAPQSREHKPVKVPEILVKDVREKDTALLGPPPAEYAGGQVATGGQVGMLGNRDIMNTPFSQTNYTEKLIRDQQARTIQDVLMNDPSVRTNVPRYGEADQFFIRGFAWATPTSPSEDFSVF